VAGSADGNEAGRGVRLCWETLSLLRGTRPCVWSCQVVWATGTSYSFSLLRPHLVASPEVSHWWVEILKVASSYSPAGA
jgi:hypothetical protein